MNIENYIESQYREMQIDDTDNEFVDLYKDIEHDKLRAIIATLHLQLVMSFKLMNTRLPTNENGAHFWADNSRYLIRTIDIILDLNNTLSNTKYAFKIDDYYSQLLQHCKTFLSSGGGSQLPPNMPKIDLYYIEPIFTMANTITVANPQTHSTYGEELIGRGSYADVYRYKDTFYNRYFAIKKAKPELTAKELARFKREFEEMDKLSSPYVLEVYRYDDEKNEYIMEYMDHTLHSYITNNNSTLSFLQKKALIQQILRAFDYIHSKNILHRDINPQNILIKEYDDVPVVKISDFGIVKIPESTLTSVNTKFKGSYNDLSLDIDGFDTYSMVHETYALTRVVLFILTQQINANKLPEGKLKNFAIKGLNADKNARFNSVKEMIDEIRTWNE